MYKQGTQKHEYELFFFFKIVKNLINDDRNPL